jgi:hypothetical protein
MEHKVKIVELLEKHKINKVWKDIPLCHMISTLIIKPTLKIDVLKMEHAF